LEKLNCSIKTTSGDLSTSASTQISRLKEILVVPIFCPAAPTGIRQKVIPFELKKERNHHGEQIKRQTGNQTGGSCDRER